MHTHTPNQKGDRTKEVSYTRQNWEFSVFFSFFKSTGTRWVSTFESQFCQLCVHEKWCFSSKLQCGRVMPWRVRQNFMNYILIDWLRFEWILSVFSIMLSAWMVINDIDANDSRTKNPIKISKIAEKRKKKNEEYPRKQWKQSHARDLLR